MLQLLVEQPGELVPVGVVVAEPEPAELVAAGGQQPAAAVGLQDDVHPGAVDEEGDFQFGDAPGVLARRLQLDLLVEGQVGAV